MHSSRWNTLRRGVPPGNHSLLRGRPRQTYFCKASIIFGGTLSAQVRDKIGEHTGTCISYSTLMHISCYVGGMFINQLSLLCKIKLASNRKERCWFRKTILHYPSPFSPPKDANSVRSDCVPVEYEERYLCIVHSNCTGDYLMCWDSTVYGSRWNCQLLMLFPAPQTLIEERPGRFCHVNELNVYLPRQRGEGIWMGLRLTLDCPSAV